MRTDSGRYGFGLLAERHAIRGQQTAMAAPIGIAAMLQNIGG